MTDWDPMSGEPFPKPAWRPGADRDAQYWWDLTCWQRNEISRLGAERDALDYKLVSQVTEWGHAMDRAEAAEAERDKFRAGWHATNEDALDAARAERDVAVESLAYGDEKRRAAVARAEAAEATLTRAENAWRGEVRRFKDDAAEQQRRAEAAEARVVELDLFVGIMRARIAAAVVVIGPDPATDTSREARIRSALDVEVTHKGWQITRAEAAEAMHAASAATSREFWQRAEAAEARVTELERLMEQEDHEWMRERDEVYRDHAVDKARIANAIEQIEDDVDGCCVRSTLLGKECR